jgi:hypothetical protein
MEALILAAATGIATLLILAVTAIIIVRLTITGTASPDRASVLRGRFAA